ncbi:MAG TPA: hypothetical protein VK849_14415, partial [Longimicrobiales bacterium]|nr:hypothetical protein [Longimicrobiales bacterium]
GAGAAPVSERRSLLVEAPADPGLVSGVPGLVRRARRAVEALQALWPEDWAPESLTRLAQTGRRITLCPETAREELVALKEAVPAEMRRLESLQGDPSAVRRAIALLADRIEGAVGDAEEGGGARRGSARG